MLSHVSNWIAIWCSISLVCSELVWVNGYGCVWWCGDWVRFISNVPIRLFLSSKVMVLRLETSIIIFRSICLTNPCSGNTFSQYRIWDPKDDSRAFSWVSYCPFNYGPSYVIWFASSVSATSDSFCSLDWYSWDSGAIVAVASVRVMIAACVGLKAFSAFTQDTAISLDVDELYSIIFFSIHGGTGA